MLFSVSIRRALAALSALLLAVGMIFSAFADYDLSPALEIIKSKAEVKKCGILNTPLCFSERDFEPIVGKAEYITILTLPDRNAGKLSVGQIDLAAGQTVTKRSLESLIFTPCKDKIGSASFTFCDASAGSDRYGVCTVYILERQNEAPKAEPCDFETVQNITYKGFLAASDPENDAMTFAIASRAKHGTVRLCDAETGLYMYTPKRDFTGRDIFSFCVTDCYGNRSAVMRVTVHVTETQEDTAFYDMTNHWAHAAAIRMTRAGIRMEAVRDGKRYFEPNAAVSRGDFLAVAMIAAGYEDKVTPVAYSAFADDAEIPPNIKGYAAAAKRMEIVNGVTDGEGKVCFYGSQPVTRSEAALILARLLVPETRWESGEGITDETVPAWAKAPFETMEKCGILCGTGKGELDAASVVTRAQLARIFCVTRDFVAESRNKTA